MKKFLLPENGNFYKANLHSHSTFSDGKLTPEEMKKVYMEKGYSIIAYTDHNVFIPQHDKLSDENFLALNGYELNVDEEGDDFCDLKTCHFCLIALEPDNTAQVCFHREKYLHPTHEGLHKHLVKYDEKTVDYERAYTPECINEMMKIGRDNGFFITYNHPVWSLEGYNEYMSFNEMNAFEICNFGCEVVGYAEYNEKEYDEMLRGGKRIYCVATDDNHNHHPMDSRDCDSFGGFTVFKADKLEYKTITDALVRGDFYASQGPEIYDLWIEDDMINITCSDADRIYLTTGRRGSKIAFAEKGGVINSASFKFNKEKDGYLRITVVDKGGYHANTNAYFLDEIYK